MSGIPREPGIEEIEAALRGLAPGPIALDRDRLMFEAGARSRRALDPARWAWPSVAALLALIVAGESALLARRPALRVVERLVVIREPSPVESDGPPSRPADLGGPVEDPGREATGARPDSRWATVADSRRRLDFALRFGLDGVPDLDRRRAETVAGVGPEAAAPTVGELSRLELEKLMKPGDRL